MSVHEGIRTVALSMCVDVHEEGKQMKPSKTFSRHKEPYTVNVITYMYCTCICKMIIKHAELSWPLVSYWFWSFYNRCMYIYFIRLGNTHFTVTLEHTVVCLSAMHALSMWSSSPCIWRDIHTMSTRTRTILLAFGKFIFTPHPVYFVAICGPVLPRASNEIPSANVINYGQLYC